MAKETISVEVTIEASPDKVWEYWILPEHIMKWNNASADWHTPKAKNDVYVNGKFSWRMEAKDGSQGFDFSGTYTLVDDLERIEYTMSDGRVVKVEFINHGKKTKVVETFEPETQNTHELQKKGWQSILDNFKKYVEDN